jgi:hypothetical protein
MEIDVIQPHTPLPVARAWVLSMVVSSFKGRKNVEAHLFRWEYEPEPDESYDWSALLGEPIHPQAEVDPEKSKRVLFEAFTAEERDQVINFLKERYGSRLASLVAHPMDLPIPLGIPPLSDIPEGKTMGFIRFEMLPNYKLPFAFHGFYDLAQHEPMVTDI